MRFVSRLLLCISQFICFAWSTESNMFSAFPRQLTIPKNMKVLSIARGMETVLYSASITTETPIGELTETYLMDWTNKYGPFERIDYISFSPDGTSVAVPVTKNKQTEWILGKSTEQKTYLKSIALPFARGTWTTDSRFTNSDNYRLPSADLNAPRIIHSGASGNSAMIFKSNLGTYISSSGYTIGPFFDVYSARWDSKGLRLTYSFSMRTESQSGNDEMNFWLNVGSKRIGPFSKIKEIRYPFYSESIFYCESNRIGFVLTNGVEWKRVSVTEMGSRGESEVTPALYPNSAFYFSSDRLILPSEYDGRKESFLICTNEFGPIIGRSDGFSHENPPLEFVRIGLRFTDVAWCKALAVPIVVTINDYGTGLSIAFPTISAIKYSGSFHSGKIAMMHNGLLYAE